MNTSVLILFYIKRAKANNIGVCPINTRVTVNAKRFEFSTNKYIKNFNKIIKLCLANDWLDKKTFANYKSKVKEVERVYLTESEIQSIIEKDFKTERLSLVRDIFLFSCFTGLAYIDVKNLTKLHISFGIDGEKWIFTHRQKTESVYKIPILPVTKIIIDKYENHP